MESENIKRQRLPKNQQKYYKKKYENPEFRGKEKRQADIRQHQKERLSASAKMKMREAAKERQRQCRMRKKLVVTEAEQGQSSSDVFEQSPSPYRVPQTYGKAVRKTLRALPKSPRKMKAVVSGLAKHVGLKLSQEMKYEVKPSNETETLVTNFFFRPDIVYTAPGQKDEMTIWAKGERKRVRKYYLTLHVKEAHFLFLEEYPDNPIGYSKFSSLRPQNVLFLKNTPADQCKCFLHENFLMMMHGLGLQYNHQFWEGLLCSQITCKNLQSDCWQNNCEDCQNGARLTMEITKFIPESHVQWKLWEKHPEIKRLEIKHHESCAAELLNDIKTAVPQFQEHVRIKRIQASAFENDKKHGLVLQLDFAMNYGCEWQGEVQSALWSRSSVTLFTAALFDTQNTLCFLIVCSSLPDMCAIKGEDSPGEI